MDVAPPSPPFETPLGADERRPDGVRRRCAWLRRHAVLVGAAILGAAAFATYTWAERGYYCDQAASHHEVCGSFWSAEHLHDWIYNAMSNWQSDLLIGILLLLALFKLEGPAGADHGDT